MASVIPSTFPRIGKSPKFRMCTYQHCETKGDLDLSSKEEEIQNAKEESHYRKDNQLWLFEIVVIYFYHDCDSRRTLTTFLKYITILIFHHSTPFPIELLFFSAKGILVLPINSLKVLLRLRTMVLNSATPVKKCRGNTKVSVDSVAAILGVFAFLITFSSISIRSAGFVTSSFEVRDALF